MIGDLPVHISLTFTIVTLACLLVLWKAIQQVNRKVATPVVILLLAWLLLQALLAKSGFYRVFDTVPPRFPLAVVPTLVAILALFLWSKGRAFLDRLPLAMLTYLHVIRVPVELVLWWLYQVGYLPQLLTFEGRNFDIFAGITAPVVAYFCFTRKTWSPRIALIWNGLALLLLLNVVIHAILSIPSPFQQLAFDQPNMAVFYVPFVWLPSFVVPVVLFIHLVSLRRLRSNLS